MFLGF